MIDESEDKPKVDMVPRKLDSTLENPIVLCDVTEESASVRKKRKTSHCPPPQLKRAPTGVSLLSDGDESKAKPEKVLSFSVSKNSGRITIHFCESGESSLTNFKMEQIVTKETVDRIVEAKLSRGQKSSTTSIKLDYNQTALCRCKFS